MSLYQSYIISSVCGYPSHTYIYNQHVPRPFFCIRSSNEVFQHSDHTGHKMSDSFMLYFLMVFKLI